ncbi:phosphatase PAP2 family protein [Streptomyces sp. XM4193]|nr:phosphatase PAP2 family protein [Streptomyces sp. XM4193]MCK1796188.1 phosphatase PAP2 family protein [Streptomyces sp. XM4193]
MAIAMPDAEQQASQPGGVPSALGRKVRRALRDRSPRRPRIWFEIALIGVSYWVYSLIRNAVPEHEATAQNHARWIWDVQDSMGLAFERTVNHAFNDVTWLIVGMNYYYATLHFVVTIAVLVWIYRRQPGRYAAVRTALFATTAVALVGYYFYPLAPPRLMDGMDFVDTVVVHGTWGSMASGDMANVSNQYAAMPSMHIGWSAWCGVIILLLAKRRWVKVLGVLYPAVTLVVIVATANHFWLDAVGGLLCLGFGFGLARWWFRAHPQQLPATFAERTESGTRRGESEETAAVPQTSAATSPAPAEAEPAREPAPKEPVPAAVSVPAPGRAQRERGEQVEHPQHTGLSERGGRTPVGASAVGAHTEGEPEKP